MRGSDRKFLLKVSAVGGLLLLLVGLPSIVYPHDPVVSFQASAFLLFWLPFSMFASILVHDRARRRGMDARSWGLLTLATGAAGLAAYAIMRSRHPKSLADIRPAGIAEDVAAGSARAEAVVAEKRRRPPSPAEEEIEILQERKMRLFYVTVMALPLLGLLLEEGAAGSAETVNFALFSVVFFLMVFFLRDEFMRLPLVPRQWETVVGAAVMGAAFALVPLKPYLEAVATIGPTRPFGMLNYSVLLIGLILAFFGVSNFRIPVIKAVALFAGLGGVFFGLLNFAPTLAIAAVLCSGLALALYGVHRLPPIFMPALVLVVLVLINSSFYDDSDIQRLATVHLGEFVARFSTSLSTALGLPAGACAGAGVSGCANVAVPPPAGGEIWGIRFQPYGDGVIIIGNCTGIVGGMFYGFIASVILLWVRAEWWRKGAVLLGGIMGSFITNLIRITILLAVYWWYDFPLPTHGRVENLLYVHNHIGDVMYIAFILVYWVFVFRFILPRRLAPPEADSGAGRAPRADFAQGPRVASRRRRPSSKTLLPNVGAGEETKSD
jgi:exosortase/archaeosortase family protein